MRDFTHTIYKELLNTFINNGYIFITVEEYFSDNYNKNRPFIIMRHDVDRRPNNSLEMSKIENSMGIKSTYYFRTIHQTFKPNIIKEIIGLGHEIGYHYESLAQTNGDYEEAIDDFEFNLNRLRELYPIRHIAMHGRPTSKWDSRDLWKHYDYKQYKIVSEPYFDIDFNRVFYATDAGRAWGDERINLRDKVNTEFNFNIKSTNDLINEIKKGYLPKEIMLNIHPEHWSKSTIEWYRIYILRKSKNFIKKIVLNR